jgi:hypothetical protein
MAPVALYLKPSRYKRRAHCRVVGRSAAFGSRRNSQPLLLIGIANHRYGL